MSETTEKIRRFYVYEGTTCSRCGGSGVDPEIHNHRESKCLFCEGEGEILARINLVEAIKHLVDRGALQIEH